MLAAILLAAGGSRRFGGVNKLLVRWRDRPLIDYALDRMLAIPAQTFIVVTGRDRARIAAIVRRRRDRRLRIVFNAEWRTGMSGSIARGLRATAPVDRLLVMMLADMPLNAVSIRPLLAAVRAGAVAARPFAAGRPGHPVLVRRNAVLTRADDGDRGLWPRLAARGERLASVAGDRRSRLDIDERSVMRDFRLKTMHIRVGR